MVFFLTLALQDLLVFEDEDDFRSKVAYLYNKLDEDDSGGMYLARYASYIDR